MKIVLDTLQVDNKQHISETSEYPKDSTYDSLDENFCTWRSYFILHYSSVNRGIMYKLYNSVLRNSAIIVFVFIFMEDCHYVSFKMFRIRPGCIIVYHVILNIQSNATMKNCMLW